MEYDPNDCNEAPAPRAADAVIEFHVEITSPEDDVREEDGENLLFDGGLNLAKVARSLNLHAVDTKGKSQKLAPTLESRDGKNQNAPSSTPHGHKSRLPIHRPPQVKSQCLAGHDETKQVVHSSPQSLHPSSESSSTA